MKEKPAYEKDVYDPKNRGGGSEELKKAPLNNSNSHFGATPDKKPFKEDIKESHPETADEAPGDGTPSSLESFGGYDHTEKDEDAKS